jgi:hypothetical protein
LRAAACRSGLFHRSFRVRSQPPSALVPVLQTRSSSAPRSFSRCTLTTQCVRFLDFPQEDAPTESRLRRLGDLCRYRFPEDRRPQPSPNRFGDVLHSDAMATIDSPRMNRCQRQRLLGTQPEARIAIGSRIDRPGPPTRRRSIHAGTCLLAAHPSGLPPYPAFPDTREVSTNRVSQPGGVAVQRTQTLATHLLCSRCAG